MDLEKVLGLKEGSDYALIKTLYDRPKKQPDGSYSKALLTLIYKNVKENKLEKFEIEDPKIEGYKVKENVRLEHPEAYIRREYLDKIEFSYANRARDLAKILGKEAESFYFNSLKNRNFAAAENIVYYKDFFSTDVDIEDFYRLKSLEHFGIHEDVYKELSKGYMDIETDIYNDDTFDVGEAVGEAPINAVTFISGRDKKSFTLVLRNDKNPLIQEVEDDIDGFIEELHDRFDNLEDLEGKKIFKGIQYGVKFFDQEIDLIRELFLIINKLKLDFVFIWNMRFDIRYILQKIIKLGYDPAEIINDKTFLSDKCYFKLDKNKKTAEKVKTRSDEFISSTYSTFMDQMCQYGAVRKAKDLATYKLDAIGEKEIGHGKIDYKDVGNIAKFPWVNFRLFLIYNIFDVLIQYGIENKVKDTEFCFQKAYEAGTRTEKGSKETVYNRNLMSIYFKRQGYILGTNQNNGGAEKTEKFEGALVGKPELNSETGIYILGHRSSSVYNDVGDQDVESEYPTCITSCNIDPKTQIFRVIMDKNNINKDREIFDNIDKYDRGGKLLDDLQIREPLLFMYRWHNMPSIADIVEDFPKFAKEDEVSKPIFRKAKPIFKNKGEI